MSRASRLPCGWARQARRWSSAVSASRAAACSVDRRQSYANSRTASGWAQAPRARQEPGVRLEAPQHGCEGGEAEQPGRVDSAGHARAFLVRHVEGGERAAGRPGAAVPAEVRAAPQDTAGRGLHQFAAHDPGQDEDRVAMARSGRYG
ncbi:hypothetical protein AB0I02_32190 [Streptomyces phaeochromogenes]